MFAGQYFIEGLIVAAWTVGCGFAGLLLVYSPKLPFWRLRHAAALLSLSVFVVLCLQIWDAYVEKTRWYTLKDTLPKELFAFLTSSVKKNSGLAKRLLRVSEIWLFDYKDWPAFLKSVNFYVTDYVVRSLFGISIKKGLGGGK